MSGHSKWSQIKRQKGTADAKRSTLFTKLGNTITAAAREGGVNPEHNFKLRLAIERAKTINLPNDNIERAIKRGGGELEGEILSSVVYEGFGPGGVALVIEAITDNKNRTSSEIRSIITKYGGTFGSPKSVIWQFNHRGEIILDFTDNAGLTPADLEAKIIESGADDFKQTPTGFEILTLPDQLKAVQEKLVALGVVCGDSSLIYQPQNTIALKPADQKKLEDLIAELEDNQSVDTVYTNSNP
ncbi:MAG: YebC/PmpR family DNA-binding transcriptional regulator [Patescibacteria group bacterium]|nr:YebC/PmpR family DNA-binding transcriptional regulator [Patescibacteria group bacterium]